MDRQTRATYQHFLELMDRHGIEYLVTGAFAEDYYAGIGRDTKDLDFCLKPEALDDALNVLAADGYHVEVVYRYWLAKVYVGEETVDLITGFGNYLHPIDDTWFEHAEAAKLFGIETRLVPVTELIWIKSYIAGRERFDGADVAHLIRYASDRIDWTRLLERFGDHWDLLLCQLMYYRFVYPSGRQNIPGWVMKRLIARLDEDVDHPAASDYPFRGTLLDPYSFLVDVDTGREPDPREDVVRQRGLSVDTVRSKIDADRERLQEYTIDRNAHEFDAGP